MENGLRAQGHSNGHQMKLILNDTNYAKKLDNNQEIGTNPLSHVSPEITAIKNHNQDMWASMSFNNSKLNKVCADD